MKKTDTLFSKISIFYNFDKSKKSCLRFFLFVFILLASSDFIYAQSAKDYLDQAVLLKKQNKLEEAIKACQKAIANHPGQDTLKANIYHFIAGTQHEKGIYDEAELHYKKAFDIRRNLLGDSHLKTIEALEGIGAVYIGTSQYDSALVYMNKAYYVKHALLGEHHPDVADAYENIGIIHYYKGDLTKTIDIFKRVLGIRQNIQGIGRLKIGISHRNIGTLLYHQGALESALDYLLKSVELFQSTKGNNALDLAIAYNNLGNVYDEKEEFEKAIYYYQKTLDIRLPVYGEIHPRVATQYNNMGVSYRKKGEIDKALEYYFKSLEIRKALLGKEHSILGDNYTNLGIVYFQKGDLDRALEMHQKALKIRQNALGDKHLLVAQSQHNLAENHLSLGNFEKSLDFLQKALVVRENRFGKAHPDVAATLEVMGDVYRKQNKIDKATGYYERSIQSLEQMRHHFFDEGTRVSYYSKNFSVFEKLIKSTISEDLGLVVARGKKAFDFIEKAKSLFLLEALQEVEAKSFGGIPDSLIQLEEKLGTELAELAKKRYDQEHEDEPSDSLFNVYNARQFDLKQAHTSLINQLEEKYPDYYRIKFDKRVIDVDNVQKMLSTDQAFVEYFVGDSSIFTFLITPSTYEVQEIPIDFPLVDWVGDMRKGLYEYWLSPVEKRSQTQYEELNKLYSQTAYTLYEKLIAPLDDLPPKLVIVPDGILNYLPFEALLMEKPEKPDNFKSHAYFTKTHQISYNYSATLWQEVNQKKHTSKGLLAIAPSFRDESKLLANIHEYRRSNLGSLLFNETEVENISEITGGTMLSGPEATKDNFLELTNQYALLHLATHAKLDDHNSDFSYLAFSTADSSSSAGKIFVRDLYNMKLPLDMVVLSACETGLGELSRSEGVISLARGFAFAGAKSIVTSLWEVNDKAAAEVMTSFYRNLDKGETKELALQQAKLNYLNTQVEDNMAHPFFWASFIAIGDMEALHFGNRIPWLWLIGILSVLVLSYFVFRRK
ncbi:MAG: CHAT domain-containing protein [Bacteroidetes bacterium]|nr:CHAT domain-containing protein [Bacteroidota bacterium]